MPETPVRFQCRHILASGRRCASPSLRHEAFCYFHHASRRPIPQSEIQARRGHQSTFTLPSLEDRTSIQLALHQILTRIASNDLDPKRAGLLLYGLQIAASNLPKEPAVQPPQIEEILYDETHGPIAPESEFHAAPREKTLEQILREQWARDEEQEAERAKQQAAKDQAAEERFLARKDDDPNTLPTLQAVAALLPTNHYPLPTVFRSTPKPNPMKILQKNGGGGTRTNVNAKARLLSAYFPLIAEAR
jgi:hypothetical protein